MKKQRYKEGIFVKIPINDLEYFIGRIVHKLLVFNEKFKTSDVITDLSEINQLPIMFGITIFRDAITRGEFEIIGHLKVTSDDTTRIPHSFWQNNMNKNNCIIVNYATGEELPAKPKDCVGLEKVSVYPAFEVVERINHFLNGKSTESYPGNEVIL